MSRTFREDDIEPFFFSSCILRGLFSWREEAGVWGEGEASIALFLQIGQMREAGKFSRFRKKWHLSIDPSSFAFFTIFFVPFRLFWLSNHSLKILFVNPLPQAMRQYSLLIFSFLLPIDSSARKMTRAVEARMGV